MLMLLSTFHCNSPRSAMTKHLIRHATQLSNPALQPTLRRGLGQDDRLRLSHLLARHLGSGRRGCRRGRGRRRRRGSRVRRRLRRELGRRRRGAERRLSTNALMRRRSGAPRGRARGARRVLPRPQHAQLGFSRASGGFSRCLLRLEELELVRRGLDMLDGGRPDLLGLLLVLRGDRVQDSHGRLRRRGDADHRSRRARMNDVRRARFHGSRR